MKQMIQDRATGERRVTGVGGHAYHALSAAMISALAAGAAHGGETRIETDGRTATDVATNGDSSRITTGTTRGENAFNSFRHFRVGKGHEANLQLPDGTANLINLVHDSRAVVDGTLNSIKGGKIGGNVVFADPHGFVVGASGTLNVGSLGVATPRAAFMDRIIDPSGEIGDGAVNDLLRGEFEVAPDAEIRIDGTVNAEHGVRLLAGEVTIGGSVDVAEPGGSDADAEAMFNKAVNTDGLARADSIDADSGGIVIAAEGDATVDGDLTADGTVSGGEGGTVVVTAGNNVALGDNGSIDVSGTGDDADGGTVAVWGDAEAHVVDGARFDAEAGDTGDGGLIEVSAREHVQLDSLSADLSGGAGGEAGTFVVDPETVTVTAGSDEYYMDGGNVEIIADDSITVESGATINTRDIDDADFEDDHTNADAESQASTGDSGDIVLKAPEITLAGDGTDGASLLAFSTGDYAGGAITLEAGEDSLSDVDITDEARIDIQAGATVDAGARDGGTAGDVTVSALAIDRLASGLGGATADVDVTGALIGRDIAVHAEARTLIELETAESADEVTAEEDITDRIEAQIDDPGDLTENLDSLPGSFAVAEADATVDVNDGADLTAARDLDIGADATRLVDIADDGGIGGKSGSTKLELAVMYGQISGATRAAVAEGASVNVGRDLAVEATSDDTLKAAANAVGGKKKTKDNGSTTYNKSGVTIGGALSIGYADTTTEATLDGDVTVAEDVDVAARADNEYATKASFTLEQRKIDGDRVTGLTAAIGDFNSAVDARLGSDIDTAGNVQVTADSETDGNRTEATTGVSARQRTKHVDSNAGGSRAAEGASGKSTAPLDQQSGGSGKGIQLGGAIAIGLTDLSADARIDDGTEVVSDGNVAVQGRVTQSGIRTIAESGLSVKGAKENSLVSLATGITVARHEQEARALIGNDAVVEADGVGVRADSETPITADFPDDWVSPADWTSVQDAIDTVQNVGDAASSAGDLGNKLFSSYTTAKAKTPTDLSLTGSVNYFGVDHVTEAWIGQDADVTARGTGGDSPDEWTAALDGDTDWQYDNAVDVRARSHTGVVTGAGVVSKLIDSGDSGDSDDSTPVGVGGVFSWVDLDADTSAGIANGATVNAGAHSVGVDAVTNNLVVQVLPASGKGASIGVAGVFGLTTVNNTTRAGVANSADINAGALNVDARQHFGAYGLSGAIVLAENAGVGASAFVHNVETTTEARIDDLETDSDERILPAVLDDGRAWSAPGTITTPDLDITAAADGRILSIAIAGARARDEDETSDKQGVTGSQSSNQQNQSDSANTTTKDQVQGDNSDSGPGAGNTLTSSSDRLRQRSEGNTDQESLSGGSRDDDDQKQQQPKFGLAASASGTFNRSRMRTDARLAGATVKGPAGGPDTDVRVRAVNDVDAIAAAGAAALTMGGKGNDKSKFETALAGAAAINWLENDTAAVIDDATITGTEAVRVQGLTAGDQVAIGLALAISSGGKKNLALSGSGSLNLIRGGTGASVEDSELTASDADDSTAEVVAYDRSRSLTGGGAFFGASGKGAGLGAAATLAYIANDIDAGIHSSTITDFSTVDVEALTSSQMLLAAVTAGGGTKVAIGGAFYGAYIGNSLSARIDNAGDSGDDASVTGVDDVTVRATGVDAFAELDGIADGGTPDWLGGADALTDNDQLTQEINPAPDSEEAEGLDEGAQAEPMLGGNLTGEMVLGIAGGVQGGANSGSMAFGFSMIDTSYQAVIDGASIEASGNVDVTAANQATIAGVGFGVAAGSKGAFTGSAVANVVRADVEARIGSDRDQSADGGVDLADDEYRATVDAARVNVGASANGAVYAFSGNVAASGKNAGGAAISYNSIGGDVRARLAAADVTTTATASEDDPYAVTVDATRRSAVRAVGAAGQFSGSNTIGGTLVVSDLLGSTAATVDDGSDIGTDALAVRALDGGDELSGLWTLAGNISASGSNSFGGAFSVNTISRTQTAAIDDSTVTADGEVKVDSDALANIRTLAVAGGASGSVAASGSLTVNTLVGDEIARIDNSAITAGGVDVSATGGRSIWSLAGSASASGSTAVGFAGAVNTIRGDRAARVTGDSSLTVTGGDVGVASGGATDIVSLAVAGSASGSTAVGGSLAVNTVVRDGVSEVIGGDITADELAVTAADGGTSIHALSGSASASGSTSVGAGITVNTIAGARRALVDDADLDVASSVDVRAETGGTIRSAGIAAAVGGTTGVGGAVTTNVLDATVEAGIRDTRSRDNGQDTTVLARDVSIIDSLGGQFSAGATAGVGASAAVNRIGNTVEAFVEGRHADGDYLADDMVVAAESRPEIKTAAISGAGSGEGASVAGSLAVNIVTSETRAAIRGGAHVTARDDLAVTASDRAIVRVLGGTATFSGRASAAGVGTFNLLEGTTEALIQGGSTRVSALGRDSGDNLNVDSGSLTDGAPSPSEWSDPADFSPVADLEEDEKAVNGLAVRASSVQQVGVIGTSVSVTVPRLTGSGSVAAIGNLNVAGGETRAAIEDATINPAAAGSLDPTADVEVGASSHIFNVGYVFAASGGGWGALTGSLETNVIQRRTEADIDGADVNAGDAVRVDADSTQSATSFALGASGAGVTLTGSASLGVVRGETHAIIDGGSDVDAGAGGVTVEADTGIDAVTIGGAAGAGATAAGASFGIAATEAVTRAGIAGNGTQVTTPGAVDVRADSETGLTPASATASFGASAAIAGAASIGVIANTTEATVDRAAVGTNTNRVGSLTVEATDTVTVDTVAGAIGVSAQDVGLGAGAGVLVIQSDTRAEILGADVYSSGDVKVTAEREADLLLAATTAGAGSGVGLAGSIGVIVIGDGSVTSDSEDFDSPDSELDAGGDGTLSEISGIVADRDVDASTNHDDPLQTVDEGDDPDNPDAELQAEEGSALDANERDSLNASGAYDPADRYSNRSADQTVARIDSSTINAGGAVDVDAVNRTATHNIAGALGVGGAVGAGLGIGVTRVYNEVTAAVDNSSVTANRLDVDAQATDLGDGATALVDAYVGAAGGFGGAAVNVADARIDETVTARVEGSTLTGTGSDASVRAEDTASVSSNAYGAAVAGGVGVTVVYAGAERDGSVEARLDPANTLAGFDDVSVDAMSDAPTIARGWAGSGGLLGAGTGTVVIARDALNTTSAIAGGADLDVDGAVNVDATARPGVTADALGIALGGLVGVGVSSAEALAEPDVEATIGDGASIDAASLDVTATRGTTTGSTDQGLAGNAIADAFDSGPACNGVADTDTCAFARGASGGTLVGANATVSDADSGGSTSARVGNATLTADRVRIAADSSTRQYAEASGLVAGALAAGATYAGASTSAATSAELGDSAAFDGATDSVAVTAESSANPHIESVSGSGGVVAGSAAAGEVTDESVVSARIGDDVAFDTDGLVIAAHHALDYDPRVTSMQAAVAGASGATLDVFAAPTVTTALGAGADLTAGFGGITATTDISETRSGANVLGGSGGVVNGSAITSTTTMRPETRVDVGSGAVIDAPPRTSNGPSGALVLAAHTDADISDIAELNTAGGIQGAFADSQFQWGTSAAATNAVEIASNARLVGVLGLSVAASSDLTIDNTAIASTSGLVGATGGDVDADVILGQDVTVGSNAFLGSRGDLSLWSGRTADGVWRDRIDLTAFSDVYNYTASGSIGLDTDADLSLDRDNTTTVASGADVVALGDVRIGAYNAEPDLAAVAKGHTPLLEAISEEVIRGGSELDSTGQLVVDGEIEAGLLHSRTISIDGSGNITASHSPIPDALGDYSLDTAAMLAADFNPGEQIQDRIDALEQGDTSAADEAEIALLENVLDRLPSGTVDSIELPALRVGGGNVHVSASSISGGGSLTAHGNERIEIDNASSRYLVVDRTVIPEPGTGDVLFDGAAAGGVQVNAASEDASPEIRITSSSQDTTDAPAIFSRGLLTNVRGLVDLYNAKGDILLFAPTRAANLQIRAPEGFLAINAPDSYQPIGGVPEAEWSDYAFTGTEDVNFCVFESCYSYTVPNLTTSEAIDYIASAEHPVSDTYANFSDSSTFFTSYLLNDNAVSDGSRLYFNLGNVFPEDWPDGTAHPDPYPESYQSFSFNDSFFYKQVDPKKLTLTRSYSAGSGASGPSTTPDVEAGTIAGIVAESIDVNGTIQVGSVKDHEVSLGTDASDRIEAFRADHTDGDSARLCLSGCATGRDADNPLRVEYDINDDRIVVNDFSTGGNGYLLMRGKIASSNKEGLVRVASGYGNIDVDNDTGIHLDVNRLHTGSGGSSLVHIVDEAKTNGSGEAKQSWYRHTVGGELEVFSGYGVSDIDDADLVRTTSATEATYNPLDGQRYAWARERSLSRTVDDDGDSWFDWDVSGWEWDGDWETVKRGIEHDPSEDADYRRDISAKRVGSYNVNVSYSGCDDDGSCNWGFPSSWRYEIVDGATFRVDHSVKADRPFKIDFFGNDSASINIQSNASARLNGRISNTGGDVTIGADSIRQSEGVGIEALAVALDGEHTVGEADRAIQVRQAERLEVVSGAGDAYVNLGGGSVRLDRVRAADQARIISSGALTAGDSSIDVQAGAIHLEGSAIGTSSTPLVTATEGTDPSVEVRTTDDLHLRHVDGDLAARALTSDSGGVFVTVADGDVVVADPASDAGDVAPDGVDYWNDRLGLIGAGRDGALDRAERTYEARVRRAYDDYWRIKQVAYDGADGSFDLTAAERQLFEPAAQAAGKDVATYVQDRFDQAANLLNDDLRPQLASDDQSALDAALASFDADWRDGFSVPDAKVAQLADNYQWTEQQLRNRVNAAALQPATSSPVAGDPEIAGRTVEIATPNGSIGSDRPELEFEITAATTGLSDAQARALTNAGPGDVDIEETADGARLAVKRRQLVNTNAIDALRAHARGDVFIGSRQGLALDRVEAAQGSIRLRVDGDLHEADAADRAYAGVVVEGAPDGAVLSSANGSLGTEARPLRLALDGPLTAAKAGDSVWLHQRASAGDLIVSDINAGNHVDVVVAGGALDPLDPERLAVVGDTVRLAADRVGADGRPLSVSVDQRIDINALNGIWLNGQSSELPLGDVDAGSDPLVAAAVQDLRLIGDTAGGDIDLAAAGDVAFAADDPTTAATDPASVVGDEVTISAANLMMAPGSRIEARATASALTTGDATVADIVAKGSPASGPALEIDSGGSIERAGADSLLSADGRTRLDAGDWIGTGVAPLQVDDGGLHATSGDAIDLRATGPLELYKPMEAGATVDLDGDGSVTGTGVNAGDAIELDVGGGLAVEEIVSSGGLIRLDAASVAADRVDADRTLAVTSLGSQTFESVSAGGAMTLDAGGALSWVLATGGASLDVLAGGDVTGGEATFNGVVKIDGESDVDLAGPLASTGGAIELSARQGLMAERLRADTGAITVTDTGSATLGDVDAATTLDVTTRGYQDHKDLHADGAMTLAAGGPLEWAIATGDSGFTATADGAITSAAVTDADVADGRTVFAGNLVIDGEDDVDLNESVVSTGGDIDLSATRALTAERLRADTGAITMADTGSATLGDVDAAATLDVTTRGSQDHKDLHADGAMTLTAGGPLEWAIATGDSGFTATADGAITSGAVTDADVMDGQTAFAGNVVIDGEDDVDLNDPVISTAGDIDLSTANALTAERLRAETGAITVGDTDAAYVEDAVAAETLAIVTRGDQGHGTLEAGQAMTLEAGGNLAYTRIEGDTKLATDVTGTATGDEAVFAGTVTATGSGDYDLGRVESTGADVVASGVAGAFDIKTLRTPNGRVDITAATSAIADGESGETIDIVTTGAQGHGRLQAAEALSFEAGVDHADVEDSWTGGAATGADFEAFDLTSLNDDIHVDAGYAAVEFADARADDAEIRIHTAGDQYHGQLAPDTDGSLRADGRVELTAGRTITFREIIAGRDSDDPAVGGDAVIESINGDIIGNRIVASRDIILLALNGGLELDRLDYGGTYTLEAGRDIVAGFQDDFDSSDGELKAGRHIEITTTGGGDEPGDILLGGAEAETGHFILDAAGDIRVAEATVGGVITSGGLVAGDFIDLTAGGEIYVENGVDAGTTIDATAEGGDLAVDGWLRSGGQQTLHADGALTTPEITSGGGVEGTAGSMDLGDVTAATDVGLDAVRDIVVFSVDSGGDQAINAGTTLDFERLDAEGRIDSHSVGDTIGSSVTAERPVHMVAGLDGNDVEQASDLRLDRLEAPVATLLAGNELSVDTARLRTRGDLEARIGTLGIVHTGDGDLRLDATGPGDRVAQRFDLDIDAPAPGGVEIDTLYAEIADIDTNAREVEIPDTWITRRLELDTKQASLLADNLDPSTRAYDFQLHEMDQRFHARVDGRSLYTTAYTVYFGMGYGVDVPNFLPSHETKNPEIGGQSASRNGLRRLVPLDPSLLEEPDNDAPAAILMIDRGEDGRDPVNLDLAELGRRLQADRRDGDEDRTF